MLLLSGLPATAPAAGPPARDGASQLARIVSPAPQSLLQRRAVTVVVRTGPRVRLRRALIGGRDVTHRFRRARGTLRARLARRRLAPGVRHLYVVTSRGNREERDSVRFVVGRRASLLTLGAPRRLSGGPLRVRVATRGRVRRLRVSLNGRRIDAAATPQPLSGARSIEVSASHGLRHGANSLKVTAIRESGKYDVERRRISVARDRPLAAAGRDRRSGGGRRVLLDARRSLAATGGRLSHRWTLVKRPAGSRARVRRATSARAWFRPDRAGEYLTRVTVRESAGRERASASGVGSSSDVSSTCVDGSHPRATDYVPPIGKRVETLVKNPATGNWAIRVGDDYYDNTAGPPFTQVLVLSRCSLEVDRQNSRLLEPGTPLSGDIDYTSLVILALPPDPTAGPMYPPNSTLRPLDGSLRAIGAQPAYVPNLLFEQGFSVIGVPGTSIGSAHQSFGVVERAGAARSAVRGWLSLDVSEPSATGAFYSFASPDYVPFAIRAPTAATGPAMTVGDPATPIADFSAHTGPGFGVLVLDSGTLQPVDRPLWFDVPSGPDRRREMTDYLSRYRNPAYLAMIIAGNRTTVEKGDDVWQPLAATVGDLGGNPDTFGQAAGGYAFVGGSGLSSEDIAGNLTYNAGASLSGMLARDANHRFGALLAGPAAQLNLDLMPLAWQAPQPFPYADEPWYEAAQTWFAQQLGLSGDLRRYYTDSSVDWEGNFTRLTGLRYPGDGHGFTEDQFELLWNADPANPSGAYWHEFQNVNRVNTLFDETLKPALTASSTGEGSVRNVLDTVKSKLPAPGSGKAELDPLEILSEGILLGGELSGMEELGVVASVVALGAQFAKTPDGESQWNELDTTADQISTELSDALRDAYLMRSKVQTMILSDPAKLTAVGENVGQPRWNVTPDQVAAFTNNIRIGVLKQAWPALIGTIWSPYHSPPRYSLDPDGKAYTMHDANGRTRCYTVPVEAGYVASGARTPDGYDFYGLLKPSRDEGYTGPPSGLLDPVFANPFSPRDEDKIYAGFNKGEFFLRSSLGAAKPWPDCYP